MSLRKLLSQKGSALTNVLAIAGAVGVGALLVGKTGQIRGQMDRDMNQNTVIENTMLDIKTYLATESNCKLALDADFASIGKYNVGYDAGNDVSIEAIQYKDGTNTARNRTLVIVFKKLLRDGGAGTAEKSKRRPDEVRVQLFDRPDPNNPTSTITTCTSFETTGVDTSMVTMCSTIGGTYNPATGQCQPDYATGPNDFTREVDKLACLALGGVLSGGACTVVDLRGQTPGSVQSSHFRVNDINLGTSDRLSTQTRTCPSGEIATGMDRNGNVNCRAISCPQPAGDTASSYTFRNVNGSYFCECTRDRGTDIDCGARLPDGGAWGSNCNDIQVDDGCSVTPASTCTLRRKQTARCPARPASIACDANIYDECGRRVCYRGPRSNTWAPDPSATCSDQMVDQTNDCGQTRQVAGTMDCSASGGGDTGGGGGGASYACTNPNGYDGDTVIVANSASLASLDRDTVSRTNGGCCMQWSPERGCTEPGVSLARCDTDRWVAGGCQLGCTNTTWTPDPSTICSTETFTQTSNCGYSRTNVQGTKDCSAPPATSMCSDGGFYSSEDDCRSRSGSSTCTNMGPGWLTEGRALCFDSSRADCNDFWCPSAPQYACSGPVAGGPERNGDLNDTVMFSGLMHPRNSRDPNNGGCCLQYVDGRCFEPGDSHYQCTSSGWQFQRCGEVQISCEMAYCACGPPQFNSIREFDGTLQECQNEAQRLGPPNACRSVDGNRCIYLGRELPLGLECSC